jgi:hypothetical protein
MPNSILFVDPSVTSANGIVVDGVGYGLVGPTTAPPGPTTSVDSECSGGCPCPSGPCTCIETVFPTSVAVAGGTQIACDDNHDGTSTKTVTTWGDFTVPLTGSPCEWEGSPLAAPSYTQDIYTCTGSDCATDCTLVSSGGGDTTPEDFGANLFLQTTPVCQWALWIFAGGEGAGVANEYKGYDGGDPRGFYSGGSVVS